MYRLYNKWSGEHFYTADIEERDGLEERGWRYEGEGWQAPVASQSPVYRLYNPYAAGGDHHYTMNVAERDALVATGWVYEGIGWYSDDNRAVPIYRQYNSYASTGSHNYTVDRSENDSLSLAGWTAEGLAWFGAEPGFVKVLDCVVNLSSSCNGMAINPISLGCGDVRVLLPSCATSDSANFAFDSDVYVGPNREFVPAGEIVDLRTCIDGELVDNADFCIYNGRDEVYERIFVEKSSEISSLFISSSDPSAHGREWVEASSDHENRANGSIVVFGSNGNLIYDGELSEIRGRGNSSWNTATKKAYQIKLAKKCDLLQTGSKDNKAKTWTLITDYYDATSLRNATAYTLGQRLGVNYAVDFDYVDLYYDGDYRGTYLLCEKVQVGKGRVDITDLEKENEGLNPDISEKPIVTGSNSYGIDIRYSEGILNPSDISGGYLVEHEQYEPRYSKESAYFGVEVVPGVEQHFVIKSPEVWSWDEANYVSCLFQDVFDSCRNNGVVPSWRGSSRAGMTTDQLVDLDSFARLYWVNELMKNGDGLIFSSTYISKDRGENARLVFGPAWDFDLSAGNPNVFGGAEGVKFSDGWWTRTSGIGLDLMRNPLVQSAIERFKPTAVASMNEVLNGGAFDSLESRVKASHGLNAYVWGARSEDWMRLKSWLNQRLFGSVGKVGVSKETADP